MLDWRVFRAESHCQGSLWKKLNPKGEVRLKVIFGEKGDKRVFQTKERQLAARTMLFRERVCTRP